VGIELVAKPYVLFLDEPTSGLDSASSMEVCNALSKIAKTGITVITVIHQPRVEIFNKFENLLLLGKGGKTVYLGATVFALNYFAQLGYQCTEGANPADFLIDLTAGRINSASNNVSAKHLADYWESATKPTIPLPVNHGTFKSPRFSYSKSFSII
jgi:ABC-type multidrug transport system ATPase subunit